MIRFTTIKRETVEIDKQDCGTMIVLGILYICDTKTKRMYQVSLETFERVTRELTK